MKPVQPAEISKLVTSFNFNSPCTRLAVEGVKKSGVTVAIITKSISSGLIPACLMALVAAFTAIWLVFSPVEILLSEIPVLVVIHWSEVSTIFSNSVLRKIFSGA